MKNNQTADLVREHILKNPFLVDFLRRDLLNVSELARQLHPHISEHNPRATVESISVAINRIDTHYAPNTFDQLRTVVAGVQLSIRTDISLIGLPRSATIPKSSSFTRDDVFFVNYDTEEVTVVIDTKNKHLVTGKTHYCRDNLAILTIADTHIDRPQNYRITPGFIHVFMRNISKEGINIEDIFTSRSKVRFVLDEKSVLKAFELCKKVKNLDFF